MGSTMRWGRFGGMGEVRFWFLDWNVSVLICCGLFGYNMEVAGFRRGV